MKKLRIAISLLVIFILTLTFLVLANWITSTTGYTIWDGKKARVAQCLSLKGVVLYVSDNCPECEEQKNMFGYDISLLNIVNCDKTPEDCYDTENLPLWGVNNEVFSPVSSLNDFEKLFGC